MKIIVTGSRDWELRTYINDVLRVFYQSACIRGDNKFLISHGNCETGVDLITDQWANAHPDPTVCVKGHSADWYGPCDEKCRHKWRRPGTRCVAAGPKRNIRMVNENLDADYVLAFPLGESRGTRGCMEYADSQGLTVINLGEK